MPNVTTTTVADFIPEIWSLDVLKAKESKLVMGNLVIKKYSEEVKNFGDTVHIDYVKNLSTGDKTADTEVTFSANTEGKITLTVNKHKYVAVRIEDIAKIQSKPDLRAAYTQKMGYALAKQVDSDLLALYSGVATTKGTTSSKITLSTILDALQVLDENDVPSENRYLVISAAQKRALLEIPEVVRYDYRGDSQALKTANIGSLYGLEGIFWTNQVPTTGTSPKVSHNLLFHKEAFALVMQLGPRIQADYNIRALATELVGDEIYGVGEVKDDTVLGRYAVHIQAQDAA